MTMTILGQTIVMIMRQIANVLSWKKDDLHTHVTCLNILLIASAIHTNNSHAFDFSFSLIT